MKITAYERERLKYINDTMDDLYDKIDSLYESIVDRDSTADAIDIIIKTLETIKEEFTS
tara:strand:- start:354 stop:530 length:177 start_codon:yes stop_codon:yes gene_type:complete